MKVRTVSQVAEQKDAAAATFLDQLIIGRPVILSFKLFDPFPCKVLSAPLDASLLHRPKAFIEVGGIGVQRHVDSESRVGQQRFGEGGWRQSNTHRVCRGDRRGDAWQQSRKEEQDAGEAFHGEVLIAEARLVKSGMSSKISAGILMYRRRQGLEVFLAHPGGPFFATKDAGHWTIPKGEIEEAEDHLATAIREFKEEVGIDIDPKGAFIELGSIRQKGGKTVHAWAVEQDCPDPFVCRSNVFEMQWPPNSGKWQTFPEVDRAQFFPIEEARMKLKETQRPLLDRLESALAK